MHHLLCVAPQEALADALSDALARVPEVLVVGLCDPQQAAQMARVVGADLIVTLEGTVIAGSEALSIPVLTVPKNADAAETVQAYLEHQTQAQAAPTPEPGASGPLPFAPITRQLRLGVYGTRGGVGTTTAAVTAAKLLAAQGKRVALYDAAQRGDPYLLLGLTPSDQPATVGNITLYPNLTLDDARVTYDALVIDGGRERAAFPAHWIAVDKPLSEAEIAQMLGLGVTSPPEEVTQC